MNVGKDPFPRDEVTGLAAFEHLEPVGSVNVVSEESGETPVLSTVSAAVTGHRERLRSDNGNARARPTREQARHDRADVTLPLDLSATLRRGGGQQTKPSGPVDADHADDVDEADEPTAAKPVSALDAMFGKSAGAGWDDEDEATRVHSHPAGAANAKSHNPELDMEWDDDEPPTEMRPFAMFDAPPIAARPEDEQDEHGRPRPEWNSGEEDQTATYQPPRGPTSIRSATPTIRTTTPPLHLHNTLPPPTLAAKALSGGRPSPFPAALLAAAAEPATSRDARAYHQEDSCDEADSAFKNLVPVPAQQLPAAAPSWNQRPKPDVSSRNPTQRFDLPLTKPEVPAKFIDALKAGHRPSVIIASAGAIGLFSLLLIVRAIASTTAVGNALLEVSPADAQVQVDGKAVVGTSSPYSVSELAVGKHELVVTKNGYSNYRGSFTVSSGQSTKLPVIELAPNLRDVGFSVRSVPAGAAVWVDGELSAQVTPAKLTGIKPGIHRLALKHDGYSDYELQMFVPEATILQLPAAELVALPSAAPEPVASGRRRSRAASSDDSESRSARHARASSRDDTDTRSARSSRRASSGDTSDSEHEHASARSSRSSRHSGSDSDDLGSPASSAVSASAAAEGGKTGTLRLNTRPWSQVSVDGRMIGNTPQPNLQLAAGKHKLQLTNPQLGVSKNVTVTIKAGETLTQVVNLAE